MNERTIAPPTKDDREDDQRSVAQEPEVIFSPPNAVKKLPENVQKSMLEITAMMGGLSGPMQHPLARKINEEHITDMLKLAENDSKRDYDDRQITKKYHLAYASIAALLFVFAVWFLGEKNPELFKEILKYLATFGGGTGVGYAIRARKKDDNDD